MKGSRRVCLGVIVGVRGIRGEVRIKSFTEDPVDVAAYGPVTASDGRTFTLSVSGAGQGVVIARIEGVADRTAAEGLRGLELFVDRSVLPAPEAGTFYQTDLIGAAVELTTGEALGEVIAVHNFGGGDLVEVGRKGAESVLIPLTGDVVESLDVAAGRMMVNPIPGLLDNGTDKDARKEEDESA